MPASPIGLASIAGLAGLRSAAPGRAMRIRIVAVLVALALPCVPAAEPERAPDIVGLGPASPSDEAARRFVLGEDDE